MQAPEWRERRRLRLSSLGWGRRARPASTRDDETGLLHKTAFLVVGAHVLSYSGRLGESCGLVCVGLEAAARPGAPVGPEQLRLAVKLLEEATRAEDVLGRTGILELSAMLPGADEDDARSVARRLEDVFGLAAAVHSAVASPGSVTTWQSSGEMVAAALTGAGARPLRATVGWATEAPSAPATGNSVHELLRTARARAF